MSLELLFHLYYNKDDDQQYLKVSLAVNGIHFNLQGEERRKSYNGISYHNPHLSGVKSAYLVDLFIFEDTLEDEMPNFYMADQALHIVNNELQQEKSFAKNTKDT